MLEMTFSGLRTCPMDRQPVMLLQQNEGGAYLPIVIGSHEAQAISLGWQNVPTPRPMSHDLICNLLVHLGAQITSIYINDFKEGIFFARLILDANGRHAEVDSRPSDAVALAVRLKVPIMVEEWIVRDAGFLSNEPQGEADRRDRREEEKNLAPFRDFINNLDLDDLEPKR